MNPDYDLTRTTSHPKTTSISVDRTFAGYLISSKISVVRRRYPIMGKGSRHVLSNSGTGCHVQQLVFLGKEPIKKFGNGEIGFFHISRRVLQEMSHFFSCTLSGS